MVIVDLRGKGFSFYLLKLSDLEGSFVAAGVADPTGVAAVILDDTVANSIQAARPGVGDLTLQIGNAGQTQSDSLAHTSYTCPQNCEITIIL
jgi:hypothetical protein